MYFKNGNARGPAIVLRITTGESSKSDSLQTQSNTAKSRCLTLVSTGGSWNTTIKSQEDRSEPASPTHPTSGYSDYFFIPRPFKSKECFQFKCNKYFTVQNTINVITASQVSTVPFFVASGK